MLYGLACIQILFSNMVYAENIDNSTQLLIEQGNEVTDDEFTQYAASPYYRVKGTLHYQGKLVSGADPNSFVLLGSRAYYFGKDQTTVYFSGKPIIGADLESFSVISSVHSKDKSHVYYQEKIINQASPNTSISLEGQKTHRKQLNYLLDENAVYYEDKKLPDSDPASFKIISPYYEKDKNHVYANGRILSHLDAATFEILSFPYTKDKNHVYFGGKLIPNADSASFQEFKGQYNYFSAREFGQYAKDKNSVYRNKIAIPGVDQTSFDLLRYGEINSVYAKDKDHVYFDGMLIPQADFASFELIDTEYAKDKNRVYLNGEPQRGLNPKTFKMFECSYQSDGDAVYHVYKQNMYEMGERMVQFDAPSFEVLSCVMYLSHRYRGHVEYVKDKNGVYFDRSFILGADPSTFELVNPNDEACRYGRDKHQLYEDGIAVSANIDRASFECLPHGGTINAIQLKQDQYTRDKNHIYYLNQPILDADRETFRILEMDFSADDKYAYYKNQRIEGVDINTFIPSRYPRNTTAHTWTPLEYSIDKSAVYYRTKRMIGSDPESFRLLVDPEVGEHKYVKDKHHVYLDGQIVAQADPATFRFMNERYSAYAKDNKNIYFAGQIVKEADRQSFSWVNDKRNHENGYFKDKAHIYYDGQIVTDANVKQFTALDDPYCDGLDCYFTDQVYIYHKGDSMTEMDAPSFVVSSSNYAKDKHHVYYRQYSSAPFIVLQGLDPNEFLVPQTN